MGEATPRQGGVNGMKAGMRSAEWGEEEKKVLKNMKTNVETSKSESDHVFSCSFGSGVTATATVDMNAVRLGLEGWIKLKFDGLVTPANEHLYRAWMLDVHQKVADISHQKIMLGFGEDETKLEVYQFEAGRAYSRVR